MLKTVVKCSAPSSIMVSASGVIAGTACATLVGELHILLAVFCLLCAACLQIWANLTYCWFLTRENRQDVTDALFDPGETRKFPLEYVLRSGSMTALTVGLMIALAISASGGWVVIVAGSVLLGLVYLMMGGSRVISRYPVKPFFDFLVMGPGVVMLTAYVQIAHLHHVINIWDVMIPSATMGVVIGLYVIACIAAHGYVLVDYDRSVGKRTLTQSYGRRTTLVFLWCSLAVALCAKVFLLKLMGVTNPYLVYGIPLAFALINSGILIALPHIDRHNWRAPQNWIMASMLAFAIVMLLLFTVIDAPVDFRVVFTLNPGA